MLSALPSPVTGGLKACFGSDAKPIFAGRAAEVGVTAASLAAKGMTGPIGVLEDSRGFVRLFNEGVFERSLLDELGHKWRLLEPGIDVKRIPVCLSAQAAVDAILDLVADHSLSITEIKSVSCDVSPIVVANLAYGTPSTPQQAQFSLNFAIACALVFGDVALTHLQPAVITDPRLQRAMARVNMVSSGRWTAKDNLTRLCPEGAFVEVAMVDGRRFARFNGFARGTTKRPLSNRELEDKFMTCVGDVIGVDQGEHLLQNLRRLDELGSVRELLKPLRWSTDKGACLALADK